MKLRFYKKYIIVFYFGSVVNLIVLSAQEVL